MDFMKILDQTVREIKREVNLKVLKVPEIEQKVLDATNDEPWGPHGSALQELAQATKKFTECQMIMGVLWTRLKDSGPNWRHVYKALTVIEYLVANGSERAVDDILEQAHKISVLSRFEYVEPNGKDSGINVRKKVETMMALLNDKDKIQAVREKAAANRDKYVGLSSTGITNRSSSTSYSSSSYHNDHYRSQSGSREYESFQDSYKDGDYVKNTKRNQRSKDGDKSEPITKENESSKFKKGAGKYTMSHDSKSSVSSKQLNKPDAPPSSKITNFQTIDNEDDFDDFDPRGSSTVVPPHSTSTQVDLFGESLVGDLMDVPPSFPTKPTIFETAATSEVDLFDDATFQSASPPGEATTQTYVQENVDFFATQPAFPAAFPSKVDFFATADAGLPSEEKSPVTEATHAESFDPFASIPLNNFDVSDPFGDFTSHSNQTTGEPTQHSRINNHSSLDETSFSDFTSHAQQTNTGPSQHSTNINVNMNSSSSIASKAGAGKDSFQVKSGIWADSLSRGLIDLNISAPKKVNLADIGIVGGLDDLSDEKDKVAPPTAFMGRAMGTGSGLGWSGFPSSAGPGGGLSTVSQQQFGNFK